MKLLKVAYQPFRFALNSLVDKENIWNRSMKKKTYSYIQSLVSILLFFFFFRWICVYVCHRLTIDFHYIFLSLLFILFLFFSFQIFFFGFIFFALPTTPSLIFFCFVLYVILLYYLLLYIFYCVQANKYNTYTHCN